MKACIINVQSVLFENLSGQASNLKALRNLIAELPSFDEDLDQNDPTPHNKLVDLHKRMDSLINEALSQNKGALESTCDLGVFAKYIPAK